MMRMVRIEDLLVEGFGIRREMRRDAIVADGWGLVNLERFVFTACLGG